MSQVQRIKNKSEKERWKNQNEGARSKERKAKSQSVNENNNRLSVETRAFCHAPKSKRQLRHLIGCNRWLLTELMASNVGRLPLFRNNKFPGNQSDARTENGSGRFHFVAEARLLHRSSTRPVFRTQKTVTVQG